MQEVCKPGRVDSATARVADMDTSTGNGSSNCIRKNMALHTDLIS